MRRQARFAAALVAGSVVLVAGCDLVAQPSPTPSAVPPTAAPSVPGFCSVPGSSKLPAAACDVVAKAKTQVVLAVSGLNPSNPRILADAFERYFGLSAGNIRYDLRPAIPSGADVADAATAALAASAGAAALAAIDWQGTFGLRPEDLTADGAAVYAHAVFPAGLVYNTRLVSRDELPKTYTDLLDPKWKGRLVMVRSTDALDHIALAVNDTAATGDALQLARGLAGAPPGSGQARFAATADEVRQRVSTGEFALGLGADGGQLITQGATLGEYGLEPIPLEPYGMAVRKDARSPELAQLWCFFVGGTAEGQAALEQALGVSKHTTAGSRAARYLGTAKFIVPAPDFATRTAAELDKRFGPILGI